MTAHCQLTGRCLGLVSQKWLVITVMAERSGEIAQHR